MAKVNFKGLKKMLDDIKRTFNREKYQIGDIMIGLIKKDLKVGLSPVHGVGRFTGYKDPNKYPGDADGRKKLKKRLKLSKVKGQRPVNLKLTGAMQDAMAPDVRGGKLFVGIKDSEQAGKYMTQHRGATLNGKITLAGPRPVFPINEGQTFTVKIMRRLVKLYKQMVQKAVKTQR